MAQILKYAMKYWYIYLVAFLSMMITTAVDMFNPLIAGSIVDDVIKAGKYEMFPKLIIGLGVIVLIKCTCGYLRELFFDTAGINVIFDLRKKLFKHIQTLSFSFFDGMNTGEIMARIKEDADNVFKAFAFGMMLIVDQSLYFVLATGFMMYKNWKLALICLTILPFIAYLALKFEKAISKVFGDISDETAKLNTIAQENISGVRLVKAFARERHEIKKFLEKNQRYYELNNSHAMVIGLYFPKIEFLTNILVILLTVVGGSMVIGERFSLGTLIAFSGYINMLIWPMRMIGWLSGIVAQCGASVKKLNKILEVEADVEDSENARSLKNPEGDIEFRNVSFGYNEDAEVVNNVNFHANKGQTIAIMGATGSGKSSIVQLLTRYYEANKGCIYFDGENIQDIKLNDLRSNVAVVMQDTFLFSETIEENIRLGNKDLTQEEVIEAAKKAQVHDFVCKMKEGYGTVIGERGIGLSGGQKQRIAIARALAAKPKVIIFDDATSALDMETENSIQQAIKMEKGLTKIIIAHRISAVKDADEILVIDKGNVVERGSHYSLLNKKGHYYSIYKHQYEGLID